jgi:outer membrane protein OmpA-like peptidoglycan-associated protein
MNKARFFPGFSVLLLACSGWVGAQESNPTANGQSPIEVHPAPTTPAPMTEDRRRDDVPLYKIQLVGRDTPAISYSGLGSAIRIGFEGTSLLPSAKGTAKVEARLGRTSIDASFEGLKPASGFGPEYLTYVLWAITPAGRPINLGEVVPTGPRDKNQITVATSLQAFGLIVTAEPYFAVTMPSDVVVVENVLEDRTQGVIEQVNAHYSLLPRGAYEQTRDGHTVLQPIRPSERSPLEVDEAINAVEIAQAAGAEKYASDTMATAKKALQNAQAINVDGKDPKASIPYARHAVQSAEDARILTISKIKAEQEARAQQAAEQIVQRASEQVRERLRRQLNSVLETTETARGLIVNMSDVLFDFNKYTLKPEAREKLAKVSGILLAYPNLKVQVEGYTDNIGSDEYNQRLSEQRADRVREYLVSESVRDANVTAKGYGKSDAVADNATNNGRAKNRRVELVVSGGAIGIEQSAPAPEGINEPAPPAEQPSPQRSAAESNMTGSSNPPH